MKTFLRQTILRKNSEKKLKHNKNNMPPNIYGTKTFKEYYQKFTSVHFIFKYKFLLPLLKLGEKLLGKALIKTVPPGHHNRNLQLFNEAWNEAEKKWVEYYLRNTGPKETRMTKKECEERIKNNWSLHLIKHYANTIYVYDTAYREFINILLHEITRSMHNFYSQIPDKKTGHLFYTVDLYEAQYFVLEKQLTYTTTLSVEPSMTPPEERTK